MAVARALCTVIFVAALTLFACGTQQAVEVPTSKPVRSAIDPRWLGLGGPDWNWELLSRDIRRDRQVFDLRPLDETMVFPNCPDCNHSPVTAVVTVYANGAYDRAAVVTGEAVSVNGVDGYYLAPRWPAGAVLAWQYDANAWATVQGVSETAARLDRLVDLAERLRPADHAPFRFPLRWESLPVDMPLAGLSEFASGGRARLYFDGCCSDGADRMAVTYADSDEFSTVRYEGGQAREVFNIPVRIGGRDGFLHEDHDTNAAINVAPGVVVEFTYSGPAYRFTELLADVVWAPDVADESTWPAVADWT